MPTPDPIGKIRYSLPRGVQVREPENIKETHSAVHGTLAVYTDSVTETQLIIDNWQQIVTAASAKVDEILANNVVPTESNGQSNGG